MNGDPAVGTIFLQQGSFRDTEFVHYTDIIRDTIKTGHHKFEIVRCIDEENRLYREINFAQPRPPNIVLEWSHSFSKKYTGTNPVGYCRAKSTNFTINNSGQLVARSNYRSDGSSLVRRVPSVPGSETKYVFGCKALILNKTFRTAFPCEIDSNPPAQTSVQDILDTIKNFAIQLPGLPSQS